MARLLFLLFLAFALGACASSPVLRSLKDVGEAYRPGDWRYIDSLLEACAQPNRDVQAASLDRLSRYYLALRYLDPASWPLDPAVERSFQGPDGKRQRERVLAAKREALAAKQEQLRLHFERSFALPNDFNVRNLCLWARARCGDPKLPEFLARAITDSDSSSSEYALRLLRPHLTGELALRETLELFARAESPLFETALGNLLLYPPSGAVRLALSNYYELSKDHTKRGLLADVLAAYPAVSPPPPPEKSATPASTNTRPATNR